VFKNSNEGLTLAKGWKHNMFLTRRGFKHFSLGKGKPSFYRKGPLKPLGIKLEYTGCAQNSNG